MVDFDPQSNGFILSRSTPWHRFDNGKVSRPIAAAAAYDSMLEAGGRFSSDAFALFGAS